jgi:hypothetical protein
VREVWGAGGEVSGVRAMSGESGGGVPALAALACNNT